jgi:Mobilization protein NikA
MGKSETIRIRLEPEEKEAFQETAEIAGIPLSAWIRERLRRSARIELEEAGKKIPFIKQKEGN